MVYRDERHCLVSAPAWVLLTVSGFAWAATAAETSDSRLVEAARNQDAKAVRSLLSQKADVNARSSDGSTALLWLAHWNDVETAELLLQAGADANAANDFRMTPLSQACTNGSAEFVRLLLKSGANPNTAIATGETPLMTCAKTGSVDAVQMLVEYGAAVNAKEPAQNQTALMWAAAERHPGRGESADRGACGSQGPYQARVHGDALRGAGRRPGEGQVVAGRGSGREHPDAGRRQPRTGGVPAGGGRGGRGGEAAGASGYTPLLVATVRAQVDVALYLLDHGADPNIGAAGFTPLHWASTTWEGLRLESGVRF